MKIICSILAILFMTSTCFAGPFGTEMGQLPSEFKNKQKLSGSKNTYIVKKLPKNNKIFKEYILRFGKDGLYEITAYSKEFKPTEEHLAKIVAKEIVSQLTDEYGHKPHVVGDTFIEKNTETKLDPMKDLGPLGVSWEEKDLPNDLKSVAVTIMQSSDGYHIPAALFTFKNSD